MKRPISFFATMWMSLILCFGGNVLAQSGQLDSSEADALEFLLIYSAQKSQEYGGLGEAWEEIFLTEYAVDEDHHVEALENLAQQFAVEIDDSWWGCFTVLWEVSELDFLCDLFSARAWRDEWNSMISGLAFLEELSIRELKQAIAGTDEQLLIDAYMEMLDVTYTHLLGFASILHDDPSDYEAQLIGQIEVDLGLAYAIGVSEENFVINPGLNDAWYEQATDGQGFFITVYPESATVFVGWFTFDMEFPGPDAIAGLGDACQRWLTAQGPYAGNQADLVVYNSSGGLFDTSLPHPELAPIGSIVLQFENCDSGTVSYDLPGVGLSGVVAIQRLAPDNVAACETAVFAPPH